MATEIIKRLVAFARTTQDYKNAEDGKNPFLLTLIHDAESVIAKNEAKVEVNKTDRPADLGAAQRDVANNIYENFDFSHPLLDANGWEYNGMNTYTKTVFLQPDNKEEASLKGTFCVRFEKHSTLPVEAYCLLNGESIGNITGGKLSDYMELSNVN